MFGPKPGSGPTHHVQHLVKQALRDSRYYEKRAAQRLLAKMSAKRVSATAPSMPKVPEVSKAPSLEVVKAPSPPKAPVVKITPQGMSGTTSGIMGKNQ